MMPTAATMCRKSEVVSINAEVQTVWIWGGEPYCDGNPWHIVLASSGSMSRADDADVGRAPICPDCGVTALPASPANVVDGAFVCENPDCDAFGETVR